MIPNLFEAVMLICFSVAWPFSIYKSLKVRSTEGKSLLFLVVLILGYIAGIVNKFVMGYVDYVLFFYFLNITLVSLDTALYMRNRRAERSPAGSG